MAAESRIRELNTRRKGLELEIEAEVRRPAPDALRLTSMKRQKLKLKEEVEALQTRH